MFKNLIITIFTILITATYTLADPIPVFCLAGWIDACKGYSSATEYDYSKEGISKRYSLSGSDIFVYDKNNNRKYSISGTNIFEYGGTNRRYSISGTNIFEYGGANRRYSISGTDIFEYGGTNRKYSISGSNIYTNNKRYSLH